MRKHLFLSLVVQLKKKPTSSIRPFFDPKIIEGIIKKISYDHRDYESVDEKSLS